MANPDAKDYLLFAQDGNISLHCKSSGLTRVYDKWGKLKLESSSFIPTVVAQEVFPLSLLYYGDSAELYSSEVEYRRVLSLKEAQVVSSLLTQTLSSMLSNPLVKEGKIKGKSFRQVIFPFGREVDLLSTITKISPLLKEISLKRIF